MNQDDVLSWDTTRWRTATAASFESHNVTTSSQSSRAPAQPLSAPSAVNPVSQSTILDQHYSATGSWVGKSQNPRLHELPQLTEPYGTMTEGSNYLSRPYERHTPAPSGDYNYGPQQLANASPRETSTGPWRSLHHHDRCTSSRHITDAPLTLHIPHSQDLPRISPSSTTIPSESQTYSSNNYRVSTPSTSLPSFAAFREHTTRTEDAAGPEIASMPSHLPCHVCTKLKPMVKEVAASVAELDENVQAYCNRSISRASDIPSDGPVRTTQWILDRLRYANSDLQDARRRTQPAYIYHQQAPDTGVPPPTISPPNHLKRAVDRWDNDLHVPKRPRSGASPDQPFQLPAYTSRDDRRSSIDFEARDLRAGFSPPPTESLPGSAHPRQKSPTFAHLTASRALPSPSSFAYPPSAAPSLPPPTVQSVGSPVTSYQPASSIHTASASSATSAHIADLQHQVTLKSLALQTLQSEYASLLQKFQRERVKSQAIERKTTVADQEVNDLTGKNEELNEQVKTLETQLEECEKKREVERAAAAKEKEQWGRMLEMSGRLHAKVDGERQRLIEEKISLEQRVASFEEENSFRLDRVKKDLGTRMDPTYRQSPSAEWADDRLSQDASTMSSAGAAAESSEDTNNLETGVLRREVVVLNARVEALRFALQRVRRHNHELEDKTRGFLEQSNSFGSTIDRALNDDEVQAKDKIQRGEPIKAPGENSTPASQKPAVADPINPPSTSSQSQVVPKTRPSTSPRSGTLEVINGNTVTTAHIAEVARAVSPGPGFEILPSTSSPEELIQALGPVPPPSLQFAAQTSPWFPATQWNREGHSIAIPAHHIPSPRKELLDKSRPPATSPRSYHSSPGELMEDRSSNSGSAIRSPEYASEPEPSSPLELKPAHAHALPPLHVRNESTRDHAQHPDGHQNWRPVMPPPPRPESERFNPRTYA